MIAAVYEAYSPSKSYRNLVLQIHANGDETAPRGIATKELAPVLLLTNYPQDRIVTHPGRRMNLAFAFVDWLMMMTGDDDLERIAYYASNMRRFSKDGKKVDGAYGPRVAPFIEGMIHKLRSDSSSRQAVISIYESVDIDEPNVPCTLAIQAKVSEGALCWHTFMRSNDVVWGLTYDLFMWTMMQEYVARQIGLPVGPYAHVASSLHLYIQRDCDIIESLAHDETIYEGMMDEMPFAEQDDLLIMSEVEERIRTGDMTRGFRLMRVLDPYWRDWMIILALWSLKKQGFSRSSEAIALAGQIRNQTLALVMDNVL